MLDHVMVATDGSALCNSALDHARELTQRLGSRLTVLHVRPDLEVPLGAVEGMPYDFDAERRRHEGDARAVERHARDRLGGAPFDFALVDADGRKIPDVIVREADARDVSLIVMGTHCRTGVRRLLAGSVAEEVLHHASQPVLLTHEPPARARQARGVVVDQHARP